MVAVHTQVLTNRRRTQRYPMEGLQDLAIRQTSILPEALLQVPLPAPRRPRGDSHRFDAIQFDAICNALMRLNKMVAEANKNIMLMIHLTRQNRMKGRRM